MSARGAGILISGFVVVIFAVFHPGTCQTTTPSPAPVHRPCKTRTSCDDCLRNVTCLWCMTNGTCGDYPVSTVLPPSSVCKLSEARWGVCWVNFEALIIAMAVLGGTILISVVVCCCCCCCKKSYSRLDRDEERLARSREAARQRGEERRTDRKTRHEEIRKKYGLIPDSDHPYSKYENE